MNNVVYRHGHPWFSQPLTDADCDGVAQIGNVAAGSRFRDKYIFF
jgi:hypothetical protein